MEDVKCPGCGAGRVVRHGKAPSGKQKYKCKAPGCGRQFVAGSNHLIDKETRAITEGLLLEKISPAKISKVMRGKISARWLYELARRTKKKAAAARDIMKEVG